MGGSREEGGRWTQFMTWIRGGGTLEETMGYIKRFWMIA